MTEKKKPKLKPVTTIEMEVAISHMFGIRQHVIVPNLSWGFDGMHECDLFIVKKSGVAVEVEIKRTKSDFLKDFSKGHNHVDRNNRITEFYYAFPENILEKCIENVPEHAGVISCSKFLDYKKQERVTASIERKPKRIKNARKLTKEEQFKVARLGCIRIMPLKEKIIKLTNG